MFEGRNALIHTFVQLLLEKMKIKIFTRKTTKPVCQTSVWVHFMSCCLVEYMTSDDFNHFLSTSISDTANTMCY